MCQKRTSFLCPWRNMAIEHSDLLGRLALRVPGESGETSQNGAVMALSSYKWDCYETKPYNERYFIPVKTVKGHNCRGILISLLVEISMPILTIPYTIKLDHGPHMRTTFPFVCRVFEFFFFFFGPSKSNKYHPVFIKIDNWGYPYRLKQKTFPLFFGELHMGYISITPFGTLGLVKSTQILALGLGSTCHMTQHL